jgi:hypothetical protein
MIKRNIFIGLFVFALISVILLAFFLTDSISINTPITGNTVGPIDIKTTPDGIKVITYRNNLAIDNIVLPEGSVDPMQIPLLSALFLQKDGKKIEKYNLIGRSRRISNKHPIEKFQAYYYKNKNQWLVTYLNKYKPYEVCDVRLDIQGALIGIECKPSNSENTGIESNLNSSQ